MMSKNEQAAGAQQAGGQETILGLGGLPLEAVPALAGEVDAGTTPPRAAARATGHATILPRRGDGGSAGRDLLPAPAGERFELRRHLGEGAMGDVDLARDRDIDRDVAIKWLKPELHDPQLVARFADEVRLVGQLEHPNIVPIHDVGRSEDGRYFFVMKYAQGETLAQIIERLAAGDADYHEKYDFAYRMRIFGELLRAIEFAHERGVIHRDLKPANVMVGPFGEVMVMDWGIAKPLDRPAAADAALLATLPFSPSAGGSGWRLSETSHQLVGTPLYMAPEQTIAGAPADERTDIYGLSALLYEFLSLGSYLGSVTSIVEALEAVRTRKPKTPHLLHSPHQPPVPVNLSHYLLKGLEKDPAQRYASVKEMRQRLMREQQGLIPVVCPVTLSKRSLHGTIRLIDRHPRVTYFALLGAFALIGLGLWQALRMLAG